MAGRWPDIAESRRGWEKKSIWWRDLCLLGDGTNVPDGWFNEMVKIKLGRGNLVRFWKDVWVGQDRLSELFPLVFCSCNCQDASVEDMGGWTEVGWRWDWSWTEGLLLELSGLAQAVADMQQLLLPVQLSQQRDDGWV